MATSVEIPVARNITPSELRSLADAPKAPSVSIYMPMHRSGLEVQQNAIRLKNLVREAAQHVHQLKRLNGDARPLVDELASFAADDRIEDLVREPSDGLAVFIRDGEVRAYKAPVRFEEKTFVNSRFRVIPLLEYVQGNGRFYVLAVSQNDVRLMEGNKYSLSEVDVARLPKSLVDALNIDEFVRSTQFHTSALGGRESIDHGGGMFHGHGGGDQGEKKDLLYEYFRRLDDALASYFHDEIAPLVFAGVDYLFPIYKHCNHYNALLDAPVAGNPEGWNGKQLHGPAWNIVRATFDAARRAAIEQYGSLAAHRQGSDNLFQVIEAAVIGRVGTLLVERGAEQPGVFDRETGQASLAEKHAPNSEDLLDYVAAKTLATSGTVYLLDRSEMPTDSPLAALYRY